MSDIKDFVIENGVLKKYVGPGGDAILSDGVTIIGNGAFRDCESLTAITIPDSVTDISAYAFNGCNGLTSVNIPDSVTSIGEGAFCGCESLTAIAIPDGVKVIGDMAFSDCESLTTVTIMDGVTTIGNGAFRGCKSLTTITIPNSVTDIGNYAFNDCNCLTGISIPKSVATISPGAFWRCKSLNTVIISEGVTTIGPSAFLDCERLTTIAIPDSVTYIGKRAFENCKRLTAITIPDSVKNIGERAFLGCKSLTAIAIPDSVTYIGNYAFNGCKSLTAIAIPDSVTYISNYTFNGCKCLNKLTLSGSAGVFVTKLFNYSDKLRIDIQDISSLPAKFRICAALCFAEDGGNAADPRYESHIKYLKANSGKITEIAVQNIPLLTLICRECCIKAKDIEAYVDAVRKTGDAEAITMILEYHNSKLTKKQKENVIRQKEKQADISFDRAIARMNQLGIDGLNFVITGTVSTFANRSELKAFIESQGGKLQSAISAKTDYLIMSGRYADIEKKKKAETLGIDIITEEQFNDKSGRAFVIEDGKLIKYRGAGGDVVIPVSVTTIGGGVFWRCRSLITVTIPVGIITIGNYAFSDCNGLTTVNIPDSVTHIGACAFIGCKSLTIHAPAGSYTEQYAKENNIPFVAEG